VFGCALVCVCVSAHSFLHRCTHPLETVCEYSTGHRDMHGLLILLPPCLRTRAMRVCAVHVCARSHIIGRIHSKIVGYISWVIENCIAYQMCYLRAFVRAICARVHAHACMCAFAHFGRLVKTFICMGYMLLICVRECAHYERSQFSEWIRSKPSETCRSMGHGKLNALLVCYVHTCITCTLACACTFVN
jgi:hypothetical protein